MALHTLYTQYKEKGRKKGRERESECVCEREMDKERDCVFSLERT